MTDSDDFRDKDVRSTYISFYESILRLVEERSYWNFRF